MSPSKYSSADSSTDNMSDNNDTDLDYNDEDMVEYHHRLQNTTEEQPEPSPQILVPESNIDSRYVVMGIERIHAVNIDEQDVGEELISWGQPTGTACPICPLTTHRLKKHMLKSHLPWYLRGPSACFRCQAQCGTHGAVRSLHSRCPMFDEDLRTWANYVHSMLITIQSQLHLNNLNELTNYVITRQLYPIPVSYNTTYNSQFDPLETRAMRYYELLFSPDRNPNQLFSCSPPNRPIALCHWRITFQLLSLLHPDIRNSIIYM